jgi:hypothetical protein
MIVLPIWFHFCEETSEYAWRVEIRINHSVELLRSSLIEYVGLTGGIMFPSCLDEIMNQKTQLRMSNHAAG